MNAPIETTLRRTALGATALALAAATAVAILPMLIPGHAYDAILNETLTVPVCAATGAAIGAGFALAPPRRAAGQLSATRGPAAAALALVGLILLGEAWWITDETRLIAAASRIVAALGAALVATAIVLATQRPTPPRRADKSEPVAPIGQTDPTTPVHRRGDADAR